MSDGSTFFERLERYIASSGAEIERTLQIATGALYLMLVGGMISSWSGLFEPAGRLRLVIAETLIFVGSAFGLLVLAQVTRSFFVLDFGQLRSPLSRRKYDSVAWVVLVVAAVQLLVAQGYVFLDGVIATSESEIAQSKLELRQVEQSMDRIDQSMDRIDRLLNETQQRLNHIEKTLPNGSDQ